MWLNIKDGDYLDVLRLSDISGFNCIESDKIRVLCIEAIGLKGVEYTLKESESFGDIIQSIKTAIYRDTEINLDSGELK